jgi:hypothetical protein
MSWATRTIRINLYSTSQVSPALCVKLLLNIECTPISITNVKVFGSDSGL